MPAAIPWALPLAVALAQAAGAGPGGERLSDQPLSAIALGLRMYLPAGAVASAQVSDEAVTYAAGDPAATWSVQISELAPAVPDPTAAALADEHLRALETTGRPHAVLANEPRRCGSVTGHVLYVRQTLDDEKQLVYGWLFLPTSGQTFVVLSVMTSAEQFARLQPVFDASFNTIELLTREAAQADRQARLGRGRDVVATLDPARLRSLIGQKQWYRIYRPAATGRQAEDAEVGFMSLQAQEAARGELTPERSKRSFGAMEAQTGLMVTIMARAILDTSRNAYLDVDGRYWMAWDRSQETWSVRQTRRLGAASRSAAETGVRHGTALEVIHSSREQLTREPRRWTIPDAAYLCQPEVFLLGHLLPREAAVTGDIGFYYYDTKSDRVTERIDAWTPAGDGSGGWSLVTTSLLETSAISQQFDARGKRLRRVDADGTITERIDPDDLFRLWQSKGLVPR